LPSIIGSEGVPVSSTGEPVFVAVTKTSSGRQQLGKGSQQKAGHGQCRDGEQDGSDGMWRHGVISSPKSAATKAYGATL
jgi:hypothetical protein